MQNQVKVVDTPFEFIFDVVLSYTREAPTHWMALDLYSPLREVRIR
jgi:hypothetical protein